MKRRDLYYLVKPAIPRPLQIYLRRKLIRKQRRWTAHVWPVDPAAGDRPSEWHGWPGQKQFALVLTHDVESAAGQEKCHGLMRLEQQLGFRSSFGFVPERYEVSAALRCDLRRQGFEVGVHGLNHDGRLFCSERIFRKRVARINRYLQQWGAVGFRAPAMHHNLHWLHALDILYDASTFDTDPFEPQADGVGTIYPFWVSGENNGDGYVELPYTLPQDFTLFVLMQESNADVWKSKLDWIARRGGMALMNTHPDYMCFAGHKPGLQEYDVQHYREFLQYVKQKYAGQVWHVLPRDMARFWLSHRVERTARAAAKLLTH
ncbi:MAG: hypothetical protein ACE5HO_11675 [bacterium]